jgi:hypothetical protein
LSNWGHKWAGARELVFLVGKGARHIFQYSYGETIVTKPTVYGNHSDEGYSIKWRLYVNVQSTNNNS